MIRSTLAATALAAALAGPVSAQVPGDYILSDLASNQVVATQPGTPLGVLFTAGAGRSIGDVVMDRDNARLVANEAASLAANSVLTRFNPVTNAAIFGAAMPTDVTVDGYGRYLVSVFGSGNEIYAVRAGIVTTVVAGLPGIVVALTEDVDTGGIAALTSTGTVLALNGTSITTLTTLSIRATDIEHDCVTGDFIVSGYTAPHVRRIDRTTGATVASFNFYSGVGGINLRDHARRIDLCGFDDYGTTDLLGTQTSPPASHVGSNFVSITRFAQRTVTGRGSGTAGTDWFIDLSFPGCAGRAYVTGISLGLRPGIPVGRTDTICLAPDALFLNALSGALDGTVLFNRVGTLGISAQATTRLRIPSTVPVGARIFASAVVLCPTPTSNVTIADTVAISVR